MTATMSRKEWLDRIQTRRLGGTRASNSDSVLLGAAGTTGSFSSPPVRKVVDLSIGGSAASSASPAPLVRHFSSPPLGGDAGAAAGSRGTGSRAPVPAGGAEGDDDDGEKRIGAQGETLLSKEQAIEQFNRTVLREERELCVAFRDVATFKLRWMTKSLEKRLRSAVAEHTGAGGADVHLEVLAMVKRRADRLAKELTDVEKVWRRQAESFRQAVMADAKDQTRQLVQLVKKETEQEIAQEKVAVERALASERNGIEQHAVQATNQTEADYRKRLDDLAAEVQRLEAAQSDAVREDSSLATARGAAIEAHQQQKALRNELAKQQDDFRKQIFELEADIADVNRQITKAVEQAREVDKLAKEKGKLIDAAEVKNKMQWQKPARRTGAASGGGRHAGRGRRAAIVLDADAAKSADLEDEREAAAFETKVTNLMMRMDIQRDRATLFLGQHGGHAGKVISTYQPVLPRYDPDGLQELFNEIDEDGSATLDRGEIANMCKTLGRELTARELEVAMQNMDADGNGEVDIDEFKEWWASMKKKGQVPSWANAIADRHRSMKEAREKRRAERGSFMRNASEDQKNAMAMRGR